MTEAFRSHRQTFFFPILGELSFPFVLNVFDLYLVMKIFLNHTMYAVAEGCFPSLEALSYNHHVLQPLSVLPTIMC